MAEEEVDPATLEGEGGEELDEVRRIHHAEHAMHSIGRTVN
jgi:hypothetical protein